MSVESYAITHIGHESYSDTRETRTTEAIIGEAFEAARQILSAELSLEELRTVGLDGKCSFEDVSKVVNESKIRYESKRTSKAREWLKVFSSRVSHYGVILDVLVQQHPEYVSLAWGTMKFLFMGVVEHEEKTKQMCKALAEIGSILPTASLLLGLYPTPAMMEVVARLYAKIMQFLVKAVKWYRSAPIKHAIGAIMKPWALSYRDTKEEIWELSRQVDTLAGVAVKAEIRGVHAVVLRTEKRAMLAEEQARIQIEALQSLPATLVAAQAPQLQQLVQLALEKRSLQQQAMTSQSEFFLENKRNHIISACFMELPTSGTSLGYCKSVRDGRTARATLRIPEVSALKDWAGDPALNVLLMKSSSADAEKDFLVDLVNLIKTSRVPVIWALRYSGYWRSRISCIDILRMLLVQALEINPSALTGSAPIDLINLREAADENDWFRILCRALQGIPQVYIVVDAEILGLATEHNKLRATKWIEQFRRQITNTRAKIFISSRNVEQSHVSSRWKSESWSILQTDFITHDRRVRQRRGQNRRLRKLRRVIRPTG